MDGTTLLKRPSTEQPPQTTRTPPSTSDTVRGALAPSTNSTQTTGVSAVQAGQIAVQAVGGDSVYRASADHAGGVAVWDAHVRNGATMWDVKVAASNGAVVQTKLSKEQPGSHGAPDGTSASMPGTSGSSTSQTSHGESSSKGHSPWIA